MSSGRLEPSLLFNLIIFVHKIRLEITMTERCKRLVVEEDKLDRLSDLPFNVINQIQEYMDIEDAARMSILSRNWRYIWASQPKLLIYEQFCRKRKQSGTINNINRILSQHCGTIEKNFLDITTIWFSDHSVLDQWMLLLSRKGLLDLTLKNCNNVNAPYKLPKCVYGMEFLQHLYLSSCIFRLPSNFRVFHRLETILLSQFVFELDEDSTSNFLWLPSLKKLSFIRCRGHHHINIYASELVHFAMHGRGSGTFNLAPFLNCRKLDGFIFNPQEDVSQNEQHEVVNLTKLPSIWPKIRIFLFDRYSLKFLASGIVGERLLQNFNNLNILHFSDINVNNKEQMCSVLCLLRSSQNLRKLCFGTLNGMKRDSRQVDTNLLELPGCRIEELNNLDTLLLRRFQGTRAEMLFLKFVLASTPSLQKIIVSFPREVGKWLALKISTDLLRLSRASLNRPRLIYEPLENYEVRYMAAVKD